jgi:hypothetical protein
MVSPVRLSLSLLSDRSTAGSPPDVASPSHETFDCGRGRVQSGTNVKVEDRLAGWFRWPRVVIDHIANFFRAGGCLALNKPIVAVKGRVGPGIQVSVLMRTCIAQKIHTQIWTGTPIPEPGRFGPWGSAPGDGPGI